MTTSSAVTTMPTMVHSPMLFAVTPASAIAFGSAPIADIVAPLSTQKPTAEIAALTNRPKYIGDMMFLVRSLALTQAMPTMLATIAIAPSASGNATSVGLPIGWSGVLV